MFEVMWGIIEIKFKYLILKYNKLNTKLTW